MNQLTEYKSKVYKVRGVNIMLDRDLAEFYGIETKILNKARKRKEDQFSEMVFQLSKEEWQEILAVQGLSHAGSYLPWAYTEKAAYKMAFVLDSKTSLKVSDLILEVFISVRDGSFLPAPNNNVPLQLEERIKTVELERTGQIVHNYFGPVIQVSGNHNSFTSGTSEEALSVIIGLMTDQSVQQNKEVLSLLSKSIDQVQKKEKTALLKTLNDVGSLGGKIVSIAKSIPALISVIEKIF